MVKTILKKKLKNLQPNNTKTSFLLVVLILCHLVFAVPVQAATTISPGILRLTVSSTAPTATATISVANTFSVPMNYEVNVVDVDEESGTLTPLDVLSDTTKKLVQIDKSNFSIGSGQVYNIGVTVQNYDGLEAGGHYAGLQISVKEQKTTGTQVALQQKIVAGLFITKEDGAKRTLQNRTYLPKGLQFSLPQTVNVALVNAGNTDFVPSGYVTVVRGTKLLAKVSYNETGTILLAEKSQQYEVKLTTYKKPLFFGNMTFTVSYRMDSLDQQVATSSVFYVSPLSVILAAALLLILVVYKTKKTRRKKRKTL